MEAAARPPHQPPYRPRNDQLRIAGLTHSDAGNFTCVADNGYGTIRKTFRVEVLGYLVHKGPHLYEVRNFFLTYGLPMSTNSSNEPYKTHPTFLTAAKIQKTFLTAYAEDVI